MRQIIARWVTCGVLIGLSAGCTDGDRPPPDDTRGLDREPPLARLSELLEKQPSREAIARLRAPTSLVLPPAHDELKDWMSPVKSQGARGTCSIFATVALMEHLQLLGGAVAPDLSEQFMQWSVKFEVGAFPYTAGSNNYVNLGSAMDYGVPDEAVWPYESAQWDVDMDPACDGSDGQPTLCYTNGHPTAAMKAAPRHFVAKNGNIHPEDIKEHIVIDGTAAVVGLNFFYQAWNHRKSELPTSEENWADGIVLYPNETDMEISLAKGAGHAILILGWDDELEIQMRDADGEPAVDEAGEPIMEKGFYLFKNSWGTHSFGLDHPVGPGYGYIAQRYVHDFASGRISALP